jgi:hypothetical protein
MNYHSRDPILSGRAALQSVYNIASGAGGVAPMIVAATPATALNTPKTFACMG